jgi:hypothetical protein
VPDIDAAILRVVDAGGRLDMATWHTCRTEHCRAGWAITLAGEDGAALEARVGSFLAGCMIYEASRPNVPAPHFFASNKAALADLRACAGQQGYVSPEIAP